MVASVIASVFTASVSAQNSKQASQALHCSTVMKLLKSTQSEDSAIGQRLDLAGKIFADVYYKENPTQERLGSTSSTEQMQTPVKDPSLDTKVLESDGFREKAVLCGAWAESFFVQWGQYQYVPVFPKVVAPQTRQLYQSLADQLVQQQAPEISR